MKLLHVMAGLTALLAGAVALYALKGARLHRRSGILFVYAMLVMASTGALMSVLHVNVGNLIAAVLTFYLVLTALRTVRRPSLEFHWIDRVAMLIALTAGLTAVTLGVAAVRSATGKIHGLPPPAYFMFGIVFLLATFGDLRVMRSWRTQGGFRIKRHLWRMCFALFIAAASFFLGPSQRLPGFLRHSPLRPVPVLIVLFVMFFWLVRVSIQQRRSRVRGETFVPIRRTV
jgi:uncharacterized membrane protein